MSIKKRLLFLVIIFAFIFSGCLIDYRHVRKYYEVNSTYNDKLLNTGELSALYDNKIYYFSNEKDGINGIYIMDTDGKNSKILFETPDIKRMTIYKDKLYFVGLKSLYKYKYGTPWALYSIYKSDDFRSITEIKLSKRPVYDACFLENDYLLAFFAYEMHGSLYSTMVTAKGNKNVYLSTDDLEIDKIKLYNSEIYYGDYNKANIRFILQFEMKKEYFKDNAQYDIMHINSGDIIISSLDYPGRLKVHFSVDNNLYVTDEKAIYILDLNNNNLKDELIYNIEYSIEDELKVKHLLLHDNKLYAVANILQDRNRISQKGIVINQDTGETNELISFNEMNKEIVYFDENMIISFEEQFIKKYYHDGNLIEKEMVYFDLGIDYKSIDYTVDFSGDWIFIYSGARYEVEHRLLCKINIVTDELISNDILFDNSQHDEIYIDEFA